SISVFLLIPLLLIGTLAVGSSSSNILQSALAQTSDTDSFSASGYTGQLLTLPPSITQVEASQNESALGPSIGSVIGGNWSFTVDQGQLENFSWNATSYTLGGD